MMELQINRVPNRHLLRVSQYIPGSVGGNRVAAFQRFQRAAFLQLQKQPLQPLAFLPQHSLRSNAQLRASFFQPQSQSRNLYAKIESRDPQMRQSKSLARLL